jgi:hypothetical protein
MLIRTLCIFFIILLATAEAQGPSPETAPPLFPKGALFSYSSDFLTREPPGTGDASALTSHPTFSHHGNFTFTWGFYPNFDLTITIPFVTNRLKTQNEVGGSGIGDTLLLMKYRFYRRDSERGTTQASVTAGPKIPTGGTSLTDPNGNLLPATLQPGSGSTDLFLGVNWTYTGLFGLRRLVADEDFHALIRTEGTQQTRLGSDSESRFWLSYRPYESKNVSHEWFIGPTLTWIRSSDQRIGGVTVKISGGDVLMAGVTTYVGILPGIHAWFGAEWAVARSKHELFTPIERHISLGITRQFRFF